MCEATSKQEEFNNIIKKYTVDFHDWFISDDYREEELEEKTVEE